MLRTSNTATIPKYVGMPCRKSPRSNRPVKITAPKATKAARANALWKELDHGTEITNNTTPTPRKRSVPKESGANVCQAYPARKTIPSKGRNPSRCDLMRYPRDHFRIVGPAARAQFLPYCSQHNRHSHASGNPLGAGSPHVRPHLIHRITHQTSRPCCSPVISLTRFAAARISPAPAILEHG